MVEETTFSPNGQLKSATRPHMTGILIIRRNPLKNTCFAPPVCRRLHANASFPNSNSECSPCAPWLGPVRRMIGCGLYCSPKTNSA